MTAVIVTAIHKIYAIVTITTIATIVTIVTIVTITTIVTIAIIPMATVYSTKEKRNRFIFIATLRAISNGYTGSNKRRSKCRTKSPQQRLLKNTTSLTKH